MKPRSLKNRAKLKRKKRRLILRRKPPRSKSNRQRLRLPQPKILRT